MSGPRPTVAEALSNPHNNFGLLRLVMALAVVVSHAFSVTDGRVEQEPWFQTTGFTLGLSIYYHGNGNEVSTPRVPLHWRQTASEAMV